MRRSALAIGIAVAMIITDAQADISNGVVRIGVLSDQSGGFKDLSGTGSIVAAEMAIEDFAPAAHGLKVELINADHQNKVDIGASVARQWIDVRGVDAIVDVPNSSVALAVSDIVKAANKVLLVSGAVTSRLTGDACTHNTIHWTYDSWSLSNAIVNAISAGDGDTWYFIVADYAFGHDLQAQATRMINAAGGTVVGSVRHPLNTADFSSFLLRAQGSRAKIIALANGGADTTNTVKQAQEFAIDKGGQKLALLTGTIYDVHSLGLKSAQGLLIPEPFYWDKDGDTRAFTARFIARHGGRYPSAVHAGVYSSIFHYLRAVAALRDDTDGARIVAKMKSTETNDLALGRGQVRVDGRKGHPTYLFEVKKPDESKGPWDYYKLRLTIPIEKAFRPLSESECSLASGR
ncbi:MAG: ABC transporter substrate-binding protein [Xanthobacteraceae bacterium]|nr:ABC transporter substrate-binding protein [Xanthobacteraceae bacterium]